MKNYIRKYRIELLALLLALLGLFLVTEKLDIRASLRLGILWLFNQGKAALQGMNAWLTAYMTQLTISDFIGWLLIVLTTIFIAWRVRHHVLRSEWWRITVCPRCGGELAREHRTVLDRLITRIFLPHGRRYVCTNPECKWTGLRHRISQGHHWHEEEAESAEMSAPDGLINP